jgi:hypothetical protein
LIAINEKRQLAKPAAAECFNQLNYKGFGRPRTGRGGERGCLFNIRQSGGLLELSNADECINGNSLFAVGQN